MRIQIHEAKFGENLLKMAKNLNYKKSNLKFIEF